MLLVDDIGENERSHLYFQDESDSVEGLEVNIVDIMFLKTKRATMTDPADGIRGCLMKAVEEVGIQIIYLEAE